ncbi:Hypothetical predicted protein [Xyrichtys novacula]|uniref:Uncharacterized protein n=1 Tax=Xyrichtys novacula TaxID=13765 RepID=A0AAV1FQG1_XYRNO|nr:Hypothetical predicted protein [Xyrichtys novacula]
MLAFLLQRRWPRNKCRIKSPERQVSVASLVVNVVVYRQGNVARHKGLFHCFYTLLEPLNPPTLKHLPADLT